MTKKLTVLVTPVEGVGHVNASVGIAERLRDRGHRIIFFADSSVKPLVLQYGFEFEILIDEEVKDKMPGQDIGDQLKDTGLMDSMLPIDKMKKMMSGNIFPNMIEKKRRSEPQLRAIVDKYNPDIILIDDVIGSPSLIYNNKPWVLIVSTNPLMILDEESTPPGGSGM